MATFHRLRSHVQKRTSRRAGSNRHLKAEFSERHGQSGPCPLLYRLRGFAVLLITWAIIAVHRLFAWLGADAERPCHHPSIPRQDLRGPPHSLWLSCTWLIISRLNSVWKGLNFAHIDRRHHPALDRAPGHNNTVFWLCPSHNNPSHLDKLFGQGDTCRPSNLTATHSHRFPVH